MTPDQYVPKIFQYLYDRGQLVEGASLHIESFYLIPDGFYRETLGPVIPFTEATDSEINDIKVFCIIVVGLEITLTKIAVAKATQYLTDNVLSNAVYEQGHQNLNRLEARLQDLKTLDEALHD